MFNLKMKITASIVRSLTNTRIKFIYNNLTFDSCKPLIIEHVFDEIPIPQKSVDRLVNRLVHRDVDAYDYNRDILEEQITRA